MPSSRSLYSGQSLVEYALILVLVSLTCVGALGGLSDGITSATGQVNEALSSNTSASQIEGGDNSNTPGTHSADFPIGPEGSTPLLTLSTSNEGFPNLSIPDRIGIQRSGSASTGGSTITNKGGISAGNSGNPSPSSTNNPPLIPPGSILNANPSAPSGSSAANNGSSSGGSAPGSGEDYGGGNYAGNNNFRLHYL